MTTKNFVVKNGLTTGNILLDAATSNVTANFVVANISVPASANLGSVSNITITGGSANYVLSTDGTGVLSWVAQTAGSSYSNANVALYLPTYSGLIGGTLTTASQPNITSVGTLSTLTVSGLLTATGGGVKTSNIIDSTGTNTISVSYATVGVTGNLTVGTGGSGNVTATYFIGNGSTLSSIAGANVTGQVGNALVAGTVYTAAQPNITSVGTLNSVVVSTTANVGTLNATDSSISGNVIIAGNLTVSGSTEYTNVTNLYVKDPIIEMGGGANNTPLSTNDGKDRGTLLHYYTTAPVDAFMGWDNSNGEFAFGSNVSLSSEVVTFNTFGNVRVGNIIGNGQSLTSITGGNVTGQVANALVAGTVYTNAQPNITSVGTLNSLTATGTVNLIGASNVSLGPVSNIHISGGSANYVLTTDGSGNLSWAAQTGGGNVTSTTIAVDNFTGDGANTVFTLSVTPTSVNSVFVNYNGAFVSRSSYSLTGANVTFGSAPANGSKLEITTIDGLTIGSGSFTTRTATGDNTTVNYTISNGMTVSSVLVTLDGVVQTPTTDYTISGTTLTFTTAPYNGAAIQIRELSVASGSSALTVKDEGSNLSTSVTSIDFVGSGVTATNVGNAVTVTVSGASNASIRAQAMVMGIIFGG